MNTDRISRIANRAIELLLIKYPTRTSLGIVLGLVLDFFYNLFYPVITQIKYIDPERISRWHFIPLGIVILHSGTILSLFRSPPYFPEEVESTIRVIENSNLSEGEKRQQYRLLIQKVIENAVFNKATQSKMEEVQEQLREQS